MACIRGGQMGRIREGIGGRWVARGRLNPLLGLLRLTLSPISASHNPKHAHRTSGMSHYIPLGKISDPCLPCSALHESYCLSRDFTWSAKLALESQSSR